MAQKILTTLATRLRQRLARLLLGPAANSDGLALDQDARLAQTLREWERTAAATRTDSSQAPVHLTVIAGGLDRTSTEPRNPRPTSKRPDGVTSEGGANQSKAG